MSQITNRSLIRGLQFHNGGIGVEIFFVSERTSLAIDSQTKVLRMNRIFAAAVIAGLASISMMGCDTATESSTKRETTITTPGGKTTITTEKETVKSGDDPPAAVP